MTSNSELIKKLEEFKCQVDQALIEIEDNDITSKSVLRHYLKESNSNNSSPVLVDAVIDYMKEKINIGSWKDVPHYIRKTITIASYLRLLIHVRSCNDLTDDNIRTAYNFIDSGIMFGCPLDVIPNLLQNCALALNSTAKSLNDSDTDETFDEPVVDIDAAQFNATPIKVIDCPSMEDFYKNYILTETPVVLDNCMNHWPALSKWKKTSYLNDGFGFRTVAVEVGSMYTDENWTQKVMTLGEFIKTHILSDTGPKGYVAQYQLFDQLPELKKDIQVPDYCCFSDTNESVDINAWYGPKGTVSPLHHDPKRNLLAQVVGAKQLFLFSPKDSPNLYPHEGEFLDNTSKVDPRDPDLEKYPKYTDAKPYYCVLKSGQMLYIPPKWWHFVESLSLSFSVSFWWE